MLLPKQMYRARKHTYVDFFCLLRFATHASCRSMHENARWCWMCFSRTTSLWPAPGSEDTELGVLMELEVGHGETEVYPRVQA
jgi:hypothetical protein